ncbi:uncharacterized protein LACBIDRAFT_321508 [Laccaria bicolor S238N-H82]|uniref:Predicted protein n=1 Tax=Laccaria bicolor (strain S238N-H82 / ATCC MYA-4686) TaxID=486041 RepID=B0CT45_LACBS|nr:uncharacterized protein LACBIDRAFT_321508 [Laccaria bicolor S238N-H82]EDR14441.1 predicted protein [Laccaria bicolor S238N-H82]|eukprot:XP_001875000.1 predicted protein [Laccaria bicolor S238N-H82]
MTTPALQIVAITDRELLPECLPNLMPFHINYNGPAAVSTFMRIKHAKGEVGAPEKNQIGGINEEVVVGVEGLTVKDASAEKQVVMIKNEDVSMEETTTDSNLPQIKQKASEPITELDIEKDVEERDIVSFGNSTPGERKGEKAAQVATVMDASQDSSSEMPILTGSTSSVELPSPLEYIIPSPSDPDSSRFVSTFRGRAIHGLKVGLPAGYVGVLLRSEGVASSSQATRNKGKAKAKPVLKKVTTRKGRFTRSAVPKRAVEEVEAEDQEPDETASLEADCVEALPNDVPIRTLVPISQFSSFVLWHADRPVDENRDEYFRSLAEWTKLAEEIHQTED